MFKAWKWILEDFGEDFVSLKLKDLTQILWDFVLGRTRFYLVAGPSIVFCNFGIQNSLSAAPPEKPADQNWGRRSIRLIWLERPRIKLSIRLACGEETKANVLPTNPLLVKLWVLNLVICLPSQLFIRSVHLVHSKSMFLNFRFSRSLSQNKLLKRCILETDFGVRTTPCEFDAEFLAILKFILHN